MSAASASAFRATSEPARERCGAVADDAGARACQTLGDGPLVITEKSAPAHLAPLAAPKISAFSCPSRRVRSLRACPRRRTHTAKGAHAFPAATRGAYAPPRIASGLQLVQQTGMAPDHRPLEQARLRLRVAPREACAASRRACTWGATVRCTYQTPKAGTRTQYVLYVGPWGQAALCVRYVPNAGGWYA